MIDFDELADDIAALALNSDVTNEAGETRSVREVVGRYLRPVEGEIERLKAIIAAKLHQRRCYDCGEVEWTSKAVGHAHTCDECYRRFLQRLKEVEA